MTRKKPIFVISPESYDAVIFDLDGVVTRTAKGHAAAWKKLFDDFLKKRAAQRGEEFRPFDDSDYGKYVDGKPRYEGVRSFLSSRGIKLPDGSPDDSPDQETVCGLGNRKNQIFRDHLERHGVEVYESSTRLIHDLRAHGLATAIVSSSKNCGPVLEAARLADLFEVKVDGVDLHQLGIEGKPAPAMFLEAARRLDVDPKRSIVVEDALAGVEAGRRGGFGWVIGVDRLGQADALREHGADLVVADLAEVAVRAEGLKTSAPAGASTGQLPSALESMREIERSLKGKRAAVFLDYDGTLTPIVSRPEDAVLSAEMRDTVRKLARSCSVAVVSGRDLRDVRKLVGLDEVFYAGSHGFDIAGPAGKNIELRQAEEFLPALDEAEKELRDPLDEIPGALIERKRFSIAIHYRRVAEGDAGKVRDVVERVAARHPELRKSSGKKVYELQPGIDWHKGKAVLWLLDALGLDAPDTLPLYVGDDTTDEDAFRALQGRGIGIVVQESPRRTAARYVLKDPQEVRKFLEALISHLDRSAS